MHPKKKIVFVYLFSFSFIHLTMNDSRQNFFNLFQSARQKKETIVVLCFVCGYNLLIISKTVNIYSNNIVFIIPFIIMPHSFFLHAHKPTDKKICIIKICKEIEIILIIYENLFKHSVQTAELHVFLN